ncbi:MAG TPA: ComEC/Rec2 family competence protein, partial [Aliiroseovarius sp.]|nr:ComEC/Rec2 family competence protein [Aliiroseovarius sp.]
PGFQMSFAATTALVAVFGWLRDWRGWRAPRWARPFLAVLISSAVAGLATAPFAAAIFNQVSRYGLLANLLAVPVMGLAVMPAAALAALLAPLGLAGVALALMRPAVEWIMWVAHRVAALDGVVAQVPSPGPWVIPLLALGGLMALILAGWGRRLGAGLTVLALGLWAAGSRPDLLVAPSGGLIGVLTPEGRVLNKPRGDGFAARVWLENDGDAADQAQAAARGGVRRGAGEMRLTLAGREVVWLGGRGAEARAGQACEAGAALVVVAARVEAAAPPGCLLIDRARLARTGALAITAGTDGWQITSAREVSGARPWNSGAARGRD